MKPYDRVDWLLYLVFWGVSALLVSMLVGIPTAYAAKMHVTWVPPVQNSDGSTLTDLAGYRIEWGSCNADGSFGTYQAGINVTDPKATDGWIYPSGLKLVCAHVFAINSANALSVASNTSSATPPSMPGQPGH